MKKIILGCMMALFSSASILAAPSSVVTEKVLKIFHDAFPEVKQTSWYSFDNYYEVYFADTQNSTCRIDYTPDGVILSTTRYYSAENLSPVIRAKVNEKYPNKKVFGVTEVTNSEKITYTIVLEDEKNWYNIESDAIGNIKLNSKMEKSE